MFFLLLSRYDEDNVVPLFVSAGGGGQGYKKNKRCKTTAIMISISLPEFSKISKQVP